MPLELTPQQPPYYTIGEEALGIKSYTALLTQLGTAAPTAIVIKNTIGTLTWTRTAAGVYSIVLTGAFPITKTVLFVTQGQPQNPIGATTSGDEILVYTGVPLVDEILDRTSIQITVFP